MSIYSGFATRFQEQAYDNCIDSLLYILQKRIIKFYQGEKADQERFVSLVLKLHHQMRSMEKSKYLQPKSSNSVNELIKFMNNFPHNNTTNNNNNAKSKPSQPAQVNEPPPQVPIQKKKSSLWVQRKPAEDQTSKTKTEQEVQTLGTINKNANGPNSAQDKFQFTRTAYQPKNIRALNVKNASRSKLSEKLDEKYIGFEQKQMKKRAMSNINPKQHPINFRETQQEEQLSYRHVHNRKNRSISRVNHLDQASGNQGQVSDIIKDYIIKAKKNYLRGHRVKQSKETLAKVHDF